MRKPGRRPNLPQHETHQEPAGKAASLDLCFSLIASVILHPASCLHEQGTLPLKLLHLCHPLCFLNRPQVFTNLLTDNWSADHSHLLLLKCATKKRSHINFWGREESRGNIWSFIPESNSCVGFKASVHTHTRHSGVYFNDIYLVLNVAVFSVLNTPKRWRIEWSSGFCSAVEAEKCFPLSHQHEEKEHRLYRQEVSRTYSHEWLKWKYINRYQLNIGLELIVL